MRHEDLAGRKCAKCSVFSIVLWLRWLGKSAPKNGRVQLVSLSGSQSVNSSSIQFVSWSVSQLVSQSVGPSATQLVS